MVSLAKIDYFWYQIVIPANEDIDRLEIQVSNWVSGQMSHAMHYIQQNA